MCNPSSKELSAKTRPQLSSHAHREMLMSEHEVILEVEPQQPFQVKAICSKMKPFKNHWSKYQISCFCSAPGEFPNPQDPAQRLLCFLFLSHGMCNPVETFGKCSSAQQKMGPGLSPWGIRAVFAFVISHVEGFKIGLFLPTPYSMSVVLESWFTQGCLHICTCEDAYCQKQYHSCSWLMSAALFVMADMLWINDIDSVIIALKQLPKFLEIWE